MRPIGTNQQLEQRRRKAVALLKQGHGIRETARRVGASPSTICDWRKAYKNQGDAFFQAHSPPGRQPNLTLKQKRQLEKLLLKGDRRRLGEQTFDMAAESLQEAAAAVHLRASPISQFFRIVAGSLAIRHIQSFPCREDQRENTRIPKGSGRLHFH